MTMTTRATWPLWQPSAETLEAIAKVIASHWTAAKTDQERSFWPTATNWLREQASATAYHFTSGGKLIK
jgi:poly(3-hydroxyalkanoate) synthetase